MDYAACTRRIVADLFSGLFSDGSNELAKGFFLLKGKLTMITSGRYCWIVLVTWCVVSPPVKASPTENELPVLAELSDDEVSRRIDFLQERFDQGSMHAQLWQYGWLAGFSTSVAIRSYVIGTSDNPDKRFDAGVGILTSASAVASLILDPLKSSSAATELRNLPEATPQDRQVKLRKAEEWLRASAREVKRRRGWAIQKVFLLEQLLAGLAIGILDNRPEDGLRTFTIGMIVSELFTFTVPTQSISDLEHYSSQPLDTRHRSSSSSSLTIVPTPNGFQLSYIF